MISSALAVVSIATLKIGDKNHGKSYVCNAQRAGYSEIDIHFCSPLIHFIVYQNPGHLLQLDGREDDHSVCKDLGGRAVPPHPKGDRRLVHLPQDNFGVQPDQSEGKDVESDSA